MKTLTKDNLFTEDLMQYEPEKAVAMIRSIIGTRENEDPFWQDAEDAILLALVKDAINQPMKQDRTFTYILKRLQNVDSLSDIKKIVAIPDKTFQSVVTSLSVNLALIH